MYWLGGLYGGYILVSATITRALWIRSTVESVVDSQYEYRSLISGICTYSPENEIYFCFKILQEIAQECYNNKFNFLMSLLS